jgi:hypothetical protein
MNVDILDKRRRDNSVPSGAVLETRGFDHREHGRTAAVVVAPVTNLLETLRVWFWRNYHRVTEQPERD